MNADVKNADEIVRALRLCAEDEPANCINCPGDSDVSSRTCSNKLMSKAADRLETQQARIAELEAQLTASQRREKAAEWAEAASDNTDCTLTYKDGIYTVCDVDGFVMCEFVRGPQEAEKGEAE